MTWLLDAAALEDVMFILAVIARVAFMAITLVLMWLVLLAWRDEELSAGFLPNLSWPAFAARAGHFLENGIRLFRGGVRRARRIFKFKGAGQ
jgi:hypothetical protein